PTDAAVHMLTFGNFFFNNGFAQVDLRKVDVKLTQHPTPRTAALVGGYADRTELHPGEQVNLHLDLVPWRGEPVRRDLTLLLPKDLPAGRLGAGGRRRDARRGADVARACLAGA